MWQGIIVGIRHVLCLSLSAIYQHYYNHYYYYYYSMYCWWCCCPLSTAAESAHHHFSLHCMDIPPAWTASSPKPHSSSSSFLAHTALMCPLINNLPACLPPMLPTPAYHCSLFMLLCCLVNFSKMLFCFFSSPVFHLFPPLSTTTTLLLFKQWASFKVLCSPNSSSDGVFTPPGNYVPWFKTREFAGRCSGLFKGRVWCGPVFVYFAPFSSSQPTVIVFYSISVDVWIFACIIVPIKLVVEPLFCLLLISWLHF